MPLDRHIVIADDLPEMRWALAELLRREGMEVHEAEDGAAALRLIAARPPDLVVLDVRMPDMSGIDTLREAKRLAANVPVILVTAYAEVQEAVEAMKAGAFDYLARPFNHREFVGIIRSALTPWPLQSTPRCRCRRGQTPSFLSSQMGPSEQVRQLSLEVARVARRDLTVVVTGETGAGKEVVARAAHRLSLRGPGPFVVVDCGGIAESLLESELFGHERGAFTGADRTVIGKFEAAEGGTLFLDEMENLPLRLQGKLLRALEAKEISRVGSAMMRKVDARVVAASNRDLRSLVKAGTFREDLFYRLCEYEIRVPALRERRDDIAFLASRFLESASRKFGTAAHDFLPSAVDAMLSYDWPGNVRELRNVVRRAVLRAERSIDAAHLGLPVKGTMGAAFPSCSAGKPVRPLKEVVAIHVVQVERQVLCDALRQTGGNKAEAARLLGIDYKTMLKKVRQYQIPAGQSSQVGSAESRGFGRAAGAVTAPEHPEGAGRKNGTGTAAGAGEKERGETDG